MAVLLSTHAQKSQHALRRMSTCSNNTSSSGKKNGIAHSKILSSEQGQFYRVYNDTFFILNSCDLIPPLVYLTQADLVSQISTS